MELTVGYLRNILEKAKNTQNISFWVGQDDWVRFLEWALDRLEDAETDLADAQAVIDREFDC